MWPIRGCSREFTSYIKYRCCQVKVGISKSQLRFITNGVGIYLPQGSVLGPSLLNIYIAHIFNYFVKSS